MRPHNECESLPRFIHLNNIFRDVFDRGIVEEGHVLVTSICSIFVCRVLLSCSLPFFLCGLFVFARFLRWSSSLTGERGEGKRVGRFDQGVVFWMKNPA